MIGKWMKSKSGTWHKVAAKTGTPGMYYGKCQSYNLDRPNFLSGDAVESPIWTGKVCKKCQASDGGLVWKEA